MTRKALAAVAVLLGVLAAFAGAPRSIDVDALAKQVANEKEAAFGLDNARLASCLDDLGADFSVERFSACTESAVGAVRASFGMATNESDVRRAIDVIAAFRRAAA